MTSIRRGWFHLASGAGIGRLFGFVSNFLLSRWLGPSDLGLFNLVTTTVQTSDTLVRCGGDYALNFELGGQPFATQAKRSVELAQGLVQICSLATAVICLGVATWIWSFNGLFSISVPIRQRLILSSLLLLMIACEGISASAWEVLLVSHRTAQLSLRQGFFFPLRVLCAAIGALFAGVPGAMGGWSIVALAQCFWLRSILGNLWNPLKPLPAQGRRVSQLLSRGLPFYVANLLTSVVFYPLLLKVAASSGLDEIGYLRAGQTLQQLFAFLPATLAPVLFLKLRSEKEYTDQVSAIELPLRLTWLVLLIALLLYCAIDKHLIALLFGSDFTSALLPTRLLLLTALFESINQIVMQPLLASGQIRTYSFWQNGSALVAAFLGWLWIPSGGLAAYLVVRLLYVVTPLTAFSIPVFKNLRQPSQMVSLTIATIILLVLLTVQILTGENLTLMPFAMLFGVAFLLYRFYSDGMYLLSAIMSIRS